MDEEKGQLQLRIQELEKQVADLKAENARLKEELKKYRPNEAPRQTRTEKDLKNIKWCGTPMVDDNIKDPT